MESDSPKHFIDATVFMGMHSVDSRVRQQSITLMSKLFHSTLYMNYEQIGACDDYVWNFSQKVQDLYYPFMDCLHSQMDIQRIPYTKDDVIRATNHTHLKTINLSCMESLLIAQVIRHDGVLFTHDPNILQLKWFSNHLGRFSQYAEEASENLLFTSELDRLYQKSTSLRVSQISFG